MSVWRGGDHAFVRYLPPRDRDGSSKEKGRYTTLWGAPAEDDFRKHLRGEVGLAIVPIRRDGSCFWGAIDVDDYSIDPIEVVRRCDAAGLPVMVTRTKSGGLHLELYPRDPVPAADMRDLLIEWSKALGLYSPRLEFFPKQTQLGEKGAGSVLNLPYFGGDRSTRYAYRPVQGEGDATLTLAEYLDFAEKRRMPWSMILGMRPEPGRFPPFAAAFSQDKIGDLNKERQEAPQGAGTRTQASAGDGRLQIIPEGSRHNTYISLIGKMLHDGVPPEAAAAAIRVTNSQYCAKPLEAGELEKTVLEAVNRFQRGPLSILKGERPVPLIESVCSAQDLLAMDLPPLEYVVDQIISESSLNMVYAWRGVGKTWFVMELCLAVASGTPLFDQYDVPKARNVLLIDGEMRAVSLRERLRFLRPCGMPEPLYLLPAEFVHRTGRGLNLIDPGDQRRIEEVIEQMDKEQRRPELIVVDNLSSLARGVDENDNSEMDELLEWLNALRQYGHAVLLVHHAGKNGTQRGASRREDSLETVIKLVPPKREKTAPPPDGATFQMEFEKHRNGTPIPYTLSLQLGVNEHGDACWYSTGGSKVKAAMTTLRILYETRPKRNKDMTHKQQPQISKDIAFLRDQGWVNGLEVTWSGKNELIGQGLIEEAQEEIPF
jgi:hypothetical protein